jgi:pSer/pThr/pTyr-binding forkhead associated (FHA) protein
MFMSDPTMVLPSSKTTLAVSHTPFVKDASITDTITLMFYSQYVQVPLPEGEEVILGRLHPSNKIQPQVDLTPYGAGSCGTSRLHATIKCENGKWWITDLGSSNGTWLNGERLAPFCSHLLDSRCHLQLANLELRIVLPERALVA